jgi:uncharacterized protein YbaR (Trm112 family)
MHRNDILMCPNCSKQHGLSVQVSGEYSLRIPVESGVLTPSFEITLNLPNISYEFVDEIPKEQLGFGFEDEEIGTLKPRSASLLQYSDTESKTVITLYKEPGPGRIFCHSCKKVFKLSEVPDYLGDE